MASDAKEEQKRYLCKGRFIFIPLHSMIGIMRKMAPLSFQTVKATNIEFNRKVGEMRSYQCPKPNIKL